MCFYKLLLVAGQSAPIHYKEQKDKHALLLFPTVPGKIISFHSIFSFNSRQGSCESSLCTVN